MAVKPGDLDNIKATLPYLLEGQQEDVLKTEARFAKPDGYGMLFTNGTGTGKTFTGLGVVKRMQRQGKNSVLIVVPDDKIVVEPPVTKRKASDEAEKGILIVGVDKLLTQLAGCCKPAPPDPIVGFVTRGKGVSIHRAPQPL